MITNILFTYYLFSLLGTIWFRNIFAIPAIFCLFQYIIFWYGWNRDLKDKELIHFQITCQICVWLGVFFGIIISIIMKFPILCEWPYKYGKRILFKNIITLFILITIQIIYDVLKIFFPVWYGIIPILFLFFFYPLIHVWFRLEGTEKLKELFGTIKIFNIFFPVIFAIHIVSLITFFIMDIIITTTININEDKSVFWRIGTLVIFTLFGSFILVTTKLFHPYNNKEDEDEDEDEKLITSINLEEKHKNTKSFLQNNNTDTDD